MVYPSHDEDANIYEINIKISAFNSNLRIPAIIWGIAEGKIKYRIRANPSIRYVREVDARTSSMDRTPSIVFSRIGQTAPNTITAIFISSPIPISNINTGINTVGGMARKNSMVGSVSCRNQRNDPTSSPTTMPSTMDKIIPAIRRPTEGHTSVVIRDHVQVVEHAFDICSQVGTKKLLD